MKKRLKLVQTILKEKGVYNGVIDGLMGPKTLAALATITEINHTWAKTKKVIAAIQVFANEHHIPCKPIDGLWGPITQDAYDQLSAKILNTSLEPIWRPEEVVDTNPNSWPKQYTPQFDAFYGAQGSNLVTVDVPYPHKFSWKLSTTVTRISCHAKVADSYVRVLEEVLNTYGQAQISKLKRDVWGGGFNIRPIRGGTKPSMHSWGIAFDYDPNRNQLRWGADKAEFAKPVYEDWWKIWEAEGWVSLGRSRNFDWMHVQAAKV